MTALVLLNAIGRHALDAPTRAGRKVLTELKNFREFLSRTDAGRLNVENEAGHTPAVLEKYIAHAVALGVEHAWGEEFVENLVELLEYDRAYRWRPGKTALRNDVIELNLRPRK